MPLKHSGTCPNCKKQYLGPWACWPCYQEKVRAHDIQRKQKDEWLETAYNVHKRCRDLEDILKKVIECGPYPTEWEEQGHSIMQEIKRLLEKTEGKPC
jgi:hypothetical protein